MNCKRVRENLVNSLAAGETVPSGELALHIRSCTGCRSFYETESNLLRSIDAGLQSMVNQDIPASLLPSSRARLSQHLEPRRSWIPAWGIAAGVVGVAAVSVLSFTLSRPRQPLEPQPSFPLKSSAAAIQNSNPPPTPGRRFDAVPSTATRRRIRSSSPVPDGSPASSEVIVLAEERVAFFKFAAEVPQETDVALALSRPAPATPGLSVEIALLRIDEMVVKPLQSTPDN